MATSPTSFQPGQSGNPTGRPKHTLPDGRSINELCREHTESAIQTLIGVASDEGAPAAARVSAATSLLDRGWGKPNQTFEAETTIDIAAAIAAARARVLQG